MAQDWESLFASEITFEDLDHQEIYRTVEEAVRTRRLSAESGAMSGNAEDILLRLHLTEGKDIYQAAVVLFGKDLAAQYPQCTLQMVRFGGKDKQEILDDRKICGNAFKFLRTQEDFCMHHLPKAGWTVGEPLRKVLQEAMVNAISHRDYAVLTGIIRLAIYDDRIEIESDGMLLKGMKVEDFKKHHCSHLRNPKITDVFYRRGLNYQMGSGTQEMVKLCVSQGHPEPDFIESENSVMVRIFKNSVC